MLPREEILKQALDLPPGDRAYLAARIEQSLDAGGETPDAAALFAELQRRSAAYRAGATTARPAADVLADLRRKPAT